MLNKFKFKAQHHTCEAALMQAAESNEIATVECIDYDHNTNTATVTLMGDIALADADALARHLEVHAPITRIVFDNNNRVTEYVWCSIGAGEHAVVQASTGDTYWCHNPESISEYLFNNDVYAPYEQFE